MDSGLFIFSYHGYLSFNYNNNIKKNLHWPTISKKALNPVPYNNSSLSEWNRIQRWRPLENTDLSKELPQKFPSKSLEDFWPSRISKVVCLQTYARKKEVILNLTKWPSVTAMIHVHVMLLGNVSGYSGENNLPVFPLRGMTLFIPWVLHGPMAAEMIKESFNHFGYFLLILEHSGRTSAHVRTQWPGLTRVTPHTTQASKSRCFKHTTFLVKLKTE